MASFFPGGQDSFVPKVDLVDTILASHVNDLQNAVASLEIGGVSKQNIAYAASITPNVPAGEYVIVGTLTGNITINAPTNALTGRRLTFRFTQDGTGGRTVTWNAAFKVTNWTVNTGANAVTEATFTYDGTSWFLALNPPSVGGVPFGYGFDAYNFNHPTIGGSPSNSAGANDTALNKLQTAITGSGNGSGAIGYIPQGGYNFAAAHTFALCTVLGAGILRTVLQPSSIGAGVQAITLGPSSYAGRMSDLAIIGPSSCAIGGPKTANVDGVGITTKWILERVYIGAVDNGVVMNGADHVVYRDVWIDGCYYSYQVVLDAGDVWIEGGGALGQVRYATIGVGGTTGLTDWTVIRHHIGNAPYPLYREAGNSSKNFLEECLFIGAKGEGVGNGWIFDEQYAANNRGMQGNEFKSCTNVWNTGTYKIAARAADWSIQIGQSGGGNYIWTHAASPFSDGAVGTLWVNQPQGDWFYYDLQNTGGCPTVNFVSNARFFHYYPKSALSGSDTLASGTSTKTTSTTTYFGPPASLFFTLQPTGAGGLAAAFNLLPGSVTSSPSLPAPATPTPGVATAGGAVPNGNHQYKVTFYNALGETTASVASGIVNSAGGNGTIPVTCPLATIYSGHSITGRKLYRSDDGGVTYGLVVTQADNTTAILSDATLSPGAVPPGGNTTKGTQFIATLQPAAPTPGSGLGYNWSLN